MIFYFLYVLFFISSLSFFATQLVLTPFWTRVHIHVCCRGIIGISQNVLCGNSFIIPLKGHILLFCYSLLQHLDSLYFFIGFIVLSVMIHTHVGSNTVDHVQIQ